MKTVFYKGKLRIFRGENVRKDNVFENVRLPQTAKSQRATGKWRARDVESCFVPMLCRSAIDNVVEHNIFHTDTAFYRFSCGAADAGDGKGGYGRHSSASGVNIPDRGIP